jgi:cell pole-organizing protein PopZ
LISRRVADDASHHFTHLARQLGDDLSIGPMPIGVRTVEEVVRELLKPLLKEWLDENLPTVVERLVQQEIDRMIRNSQKF